MPMYCDKLDAVTIGSCAMSTAVVRQSKELHAQSMENRH